MRVKVIQYVRPGGHTREQWIENMPDDLAPIIKQIKKCGLQLTAEILTTGMCSFTIEYPKQAADFDIELAENGPGPNGTKEVLERMIRRFDKKAFYNWAKELNEADDGLGVGWGT